MLKFLRAGALAVAFVTFAAPALPLFAQEGDESEYTTPDTPTVGKPFPDFTGKTMDGKDVKLADYKGKVTLVDFWATWCGPCIREMPAVKSVYSSYKDKGFEVVGISLDEDLDDLKKFQEDPKSALPWPSIADGKGWQAELAVKNGIRAIPATFLLDKEGIVIGTNLRGEKLLAAVAKAIDPAAGEPKTLAATVESYLAAKDAAAKQAASEEVLKLAAERKFAVLDTAYEHLMDEEKVTSDSASLMAQLLESTNENNDYMANGLAALAHNAGGHPAKAAAAQKKSVETLRERIAEAMGEKGADKVDSHPRLVMGRIDLALYQALAGDKETAQVTLNEALAAVADNEQAMAQIRKLENYQKLLSLL